MRKEQPELLYIGYVKVLRSMVWVCTVLLVCVVSLVVGIITILPLKEKEIHLVEFQSGGNNFVRIVNTGKNISSDKAVLSVALRQYVMKHETVSQAHGEQIANFLHIASSTTVFDQWRQKYKPMYENGEFMREIEIINDASLSPSQHSVKFKAIDTTPQGTREFVATAFIRYDFKDSKKMPFDDALINPTGLRVVGYAVGKGD